MAFRRADNDNHVSASTEARGGDSDAGQVVMSAASRKCPMCGKATIQAYRPFCSKRCADLDLGKWLDGDYAIHGHADDDEDGALPTQDQQLEKKIEESE